MNLREAKKLIETARKERAESADWVLDHPAGSHLLSRVTGARYHVVGSDDDDVPMHIIKVNKNGRPEHIHAFNEDALDWHPNKLKAEAKRIVNGLIAT